MAPAAAGQLVDVLTAIVPTGSSLAEEYVKSFRAFLMDVIYAWSKGASFGQVGHLFLFF